MRKINAKFRLMDTGRGTYLELDGKTLGEGVTSVSYNKIGKEPATLKIGINVKEFEFLPNGHFDEAEKKLRELEPPTEQ